MIHSGGSTAGESVGFAVVSELIFQDSLWAEFEVSWLMRVNWPPRSKMDGHVWILTVLKDSKSLRPTSNLYYIQMTDETERWFESLVGGQSIVMSHKLWPSTFNLSFPLAWLRIDHVPLSWKLNWNNSASPAYSNRHTPSYSKIKIIHRVVYQEWSLSQTQPNISNLGFPGFGKNLWVKIIWKTSRSLSSNHFSDSVTKSSYLGMISFWARSNSGTHSRTAQTRAVSSGTLLAFLKTHVESQKSRNFSKISNISKISIIYFSF